MLRLLINEKVFFFQLADHYQGNCKNFPSFKGKKVEDKKEINSILFDVDGFINTKKKLINSGRFSTQNEEEETA